MNSPVSATTGDVFSTDISREMFATRCQALSKSPLCGCNCIKIMVLSGNPNRHRLQVQADCGTRGHGGEVGNQPQGGITAEAEGRGALQPPVADGMALSTFLLKC